MDNLCEDLYMFLCTCQVRVAHNMLNMRETERERETGMFIVQHMFSFIQDSRFSIQLNKNDLTHQN